MKLLLTIVPLMMLTTACTKVVTVDFCPPYPYPSKEVLKAIRGLDDRRVDQWIVLQSKLADQLKLCIKKEF